MRFVLPLLPPAGRRVALVRLARLEAATLSCLVGCMWFATGWLWAGWGRGVIDSLQARLIISREKTGPGAAQAASSAELRRYRAAAVTGARGGGTQDGHGGVVHAPTMLLLLSRLPVPPRQLCRRERLWGA